MIMDKTTQYERMEFMYIIYATNIWKTLKLYSSWLIVAIYSIQSMNLESWFECYGISTRYQNNLNFFLVWIRKWTFFFEVFLKFFRGVALYTCSSHALNIPMFPTCEARSSPCFSVSACFIRLDIKFNCLPFAGLIVPMTRKRYTEMPTNWVVFIL